MVTNGVVFSGYIAIMEKPSTSSQFVSQERHIKKDQDRFWHLIRILDKNHGSLMLPVQQWWTDHL
ncbi:MAG: hypothetical protein WCF23_18225 [Candidatus Nitrosopolaris sp.]